MPRLNTAGSAVVATSGGDVSIDGAVPAALAGLTAAGPWFWYSTDVAMGLGNTGAGVKLYSYTVSTLTLAVVDSVASTDAAAGGGTWAVLDGTDVRTSIAGVGPFPGSSIGDVSPVGQLAYVLDAAAERGLRVLNASGTELVTLDALLEDITTIRIRDDVVAYVDGSGWHLRKVLEADVVSVAQRTDDTVDNLVPVLTTPGEWFVAELTSSRLTLRRADDVQGYVIDTATVVDPDAIELSSGVIRLAWANDAAQDADDLVTVDLTVATGNTVRRTVVGGTMVAGAATTTAVSLLPAVQAGSGVSAQVTLDSLLRQRIEDVRTHLVGREWAAWFKAVDRLLGQPVDLSRVVGVLAQINGGTGNTAGAVRNAFGDVRVGATDVLAQQPLDVLTLTAGAGMTLTPSAAARTVAFAVTTPVSVTRKTSDESVTSSTALQSDDTLNPAIAASAVQVLEWVLHINGSAAGGVKVALNVPSGATGTWGVVGEANANLTDVTDTGALTLTLPGTNAKLYVLRAAIVNGANAGTVTLRWAQNASDGTATTIKAGSHVFATVTT
jgi:hypothetical protein